MLSLQQLSKNFGGLAALSNVSLEMAEGEIHGLIGPNGAGKTTLLNLLTRLIDPDGGSITFLGQSLLERRPHEVVAMGIGRIFQHMELFTSLTVHQNVLAGAHSLGRTNLLQAMLGLPSMGIERREIDAKVRAVLDSLGLGHMAEREAGTLTGGQGRLLGLARALVTRPKLLLLDELVAGLNSQERSNAAAMVTRLRDEQGISILAIEHDMRFIMGIADRITVLNFGQTIAAGTPEEVRRDHGVIDAYLGKGRYAHS